MRIAAGGTPFWICANAAVAALYFALGAVVSAFFGAYGLFPAPIWLPAAIAVVAAIMGEARCLPGIFLGSFLTNALLFAPPLHITTIISLTNALGPAAGAIALRRLWPDGGAFKSVAGVLQFLFCTTLLSPAISASGGAAAMTIGEPFDWARTYSIWVGWWLCDSGGTLFLAPALLLWLGLDPSDETGPAPESLPWRHVMVWFGIAVFSLLLFLTPALHGNYIRQVFPFLLVVPLSWVALRMSLRWAYTLVSLVAIAAAGGTVAGFGPFADPTIANPLQMVGTLVVVLAMNVLTTVALVSELHAAQNENRVKSMFFATTSHELRNPLNAIVGFSSIIGSQALGPIGNEKYAEHGRMIHSAGNHLLALIDGLLNLCKIEAGRFSLVDEPIAVAEAIEQATALLAVSARAKRVTLTSDVTPPNLMLTADRRALHQILLNLLSNAVKFTPAGGRVDAAARMGDEGKLLIRIEDSGIGIPADSLDRVFQPFERLRQPDGVNTEGTGLGLSITRGLVLLHGGTIGLESRPGAGTTIIVTLPASRVIPIEPMPRRDIAQAAE